jgi:hypothetical protein
MNDEKSVLGTNEREEARDRLAHQIGRLLAHEWLRNQQSKETKLLDHGQAADAADIDDNRRSRAGGANIEQAGDEIDKPNPIQTTIGQPDPFFQ